MRRRLLVLAWLLVAAGLGWAVVRVTLLESSARSEASGFGQFVLAAVGLAIMVGDLVVRAFIPAPAPDIDELADGLAMAMRDQWEQAAIDRGLLQPTPLPIRWRRCTTAVAGPASAATGSRDGQAQFDPLPGLDRVTASALRSGTRRALHRVYGGLGSGRLVLVGGPGTGKSSVAVLLMLDALRYRDQLDLAQRSRVPIPVLFTLSDWDPGTTSVQDWLTAKLADSPLLRGRRGAERVRHLLHARRIAVFLDGLDEIREETRPVALRVLSEQANFRLVLLTRTHELVAAAVDQGLVGAVALELLPLRPVDVATYLLRPLTEPAPPAWQQLTTSLTVAPTSPAAQALTTPLTVRLLRDAYPVSAPVDDLLDTTRFPTPGCIVDHLLDQAVTAAYAPRPGHPPPRYSLDTAQRTLTFIARQLTNRNTRDFAWWATATWVPRKLLMTLTSGLLIGLVAGIGFGLASGRDAGIGMAVTAGISFGLAIGLVTNPGPLKIQFDRATRRSLLKPTRLAAGLTIGLVTGFGFGTNLQLGAALGIAFGVGFGILTWLQVGLTTAPLHKTASANPVSVWRDDLLAGIGTAITTGFVVFVLTALAFIVRPDTGNLGGALAVGVATGLALALLVMESATAAVAQAYLAMRHRTPLRLLRFMEDARSRHLLRTVGPIYQFRHATLQDRLAGVPTANQPPP
ncbi:hypothetical protein FKR81_23250 [Lentzea tibetensis]|uniref:NACHT domain-containing protein n=1 Tax=Lentzea tibetensis TaxID=2591470 RepID=A0A563EQ16_9PSEU|nr:hypothetical protein [Lentzea tibetensis]TWP49470.1 hypothetical protein FKR81_23250 [Lentzea tibetensis]